MDIISLALPDNQAVVLARLFDRINIGEQNEEDINDPFLKRIDRNNFLAYLRIAAAIRDDGLIDPIPLITIYCQGDCLICHSMKDASIEEKNEIGRAHV